MRATFHASLRSICSAAIRSTGRDPAIDGTLATTSRTAACTRSAGQRQQCQPTQHRHQAPGRSALALLQRGRQVVKGRLDQGKLGLQTGSGFYSYPNPAYADPAFLAEPGLDVVEEVVEKTTAGSQAVHGNTLLEGWKNQGAPCALRCTEHDVRPA